MWLVVLLCKQPPEDAVAQERRCTVVGPDIKAVSSSALTDAAL